MITREVRVSNTHTTCDVCGRNLLRGEQAGRYLAGGERHWVCDLCVSRAIHFGWVPEGTVPSSQPGEQERELRRPLLPRLRARLGALLSNGARVEPNGRYPVFKADKRPAPVRASEPLHIPRHLHAVPAHPEQKVSSAIRAFNASEHTRTIAGVARALGPPSVTIRPSEMESSVVSVVAAWELCWYRYEIDLADEMPSVRVAARGAELDELEPTELHANASAGDDGELALS